MAKPNHKRGRSRRIGLISVAVVVLVLLGIAGTMYAIGGKDIFGRVFAGDSAAKKAADDHAGKVALLVSPVAIPMFTALDVSAMIDTKTGQPLVVWVAEKFAHDVGLIHDPNLLKGRVLSRDKEACRAFTEADFFPKGSQASATSAIPAGKRGVRLSGREIDGLNGLKRGDMFDLIAVLPKTSRGLGADVTASAELIEATEDAKSFEAHRLIVVQNGKVIEPIPDPATRPPGKAVNDAFVSMDDAEWVALSAAVGKGAKILLGARSGLPTGDAAALSEPKRAAAPESMIIISGDSATRSSVPPDSSAKTDPKSDPKMAPKVDPK